MKSFFNSIPFIVLSAVSVCVFSFDLYIPNLPSIAEWFSTSQEYAKLTVSAGIIGSSLFTLILGPLSDAIGRRKILVSAQALFCATSFIAAFSPSIHFLMGIRFLQGVGSSAAMVLSFAIITDLFPKKKAAVYFAYISTTITVTLVAAPMVGGFIASHWTWHYCFILLGLMAALSTLHLYVYLPETLKERKQFSMPGALKNYAGIFRNPTFLMMSTMPSLIIGGFIAFITALSFYFIRDLGMSAFDFSLCQASIMFFNAAFSFLSSKAIHHWGSKRTAYVGVGIVVAGGGTLFLATLLGLGTPVILCTTFSLYGAGLGFVFAAVTSENMALSGAASGITSASITFIRGTLISLIISLESSLNTGSLLSLGSFILVITLMALVLFLSFKHKLGQSEEAVVTVSH
ncbi:MAG: MFS transporter [Alphaproteobacteria bacterium]|nr:MFS transporter [Alphaproteobacteria bacterium]